MKKLILAIVLFATTTVTYSQTFNGVSISGQTQSVVDSFKARGFSEYKKVDNTVIMNGKLMGKKFDLFIMSTPKSNQVCKVYGYFDEIDSWGSIKADYKSIYEILFQKYGKPDTKYESFLKPYYEGDGYEMQAVANDKTNYVSFWFGKDNTNVSVSISKFKSVLISYENAKLIEVDIQEKAEIAKKVF
jgi:hypothetical protein